MWKYIAWKIPHHFKRTFLHLIPSANYANFLQFIDQVNADVNTAKPYCVWSRLLLQQHVLLTKHLILLMYEHQVTFSQLHILLSTLQLSLHFHLLQLGWFLHSHQSLCQMTSFSSQFSQLQATQNTEHRYQPRPLEYQLQWLSLNTGPDMKFPRICIKMAEHV